jgi:hypothetical protein
MKIREKEKKKAVGYRRHWQNGLSDFYSYIGCFTAEAVVFCIYGWIRGWILGNSKDKS